MAQKNYSRWRVISL